MHLYIKGKKMAVKRAKITFPNNFFFMTEMMFGLLIWKQENIHEIIISL